MNVMSSLPPMGEHEEERLRAEMSDWSDSKLIAAEIKEAAYARGIAARAILNQRRHVKEDAKHAEVLKELKKPQWKTPNFWLAAVAAVASCISAYQVLRPKQVTRPQQKR